MDDDDLPLKKTAAEADPRLDREDLSKLSLEEIEERISACESEIKRCRALIASKKDVRHAADAVFKK